MCWCTPNMRTPCCATQACHDAALRNPDPRVKRGPTCPWCKKPWTAAPPAASAPSPFASWETRAREAERSNEALKRTVQKMGEKFNQLVRSIGNRALRERVRELEAALGRIVERESGDWEDKPLPEDEAIRNAFPTRSGSHETYAEAMRLVGARHSKSKLVALVNWLLVEREVLRKKHRVVPTIAAPLDHAASDAAVDHYGLDQLRLLERSLREESAKSARERDEHRQAATGVGGVRRKIIVGRHALAECRAARARLWADTVSRLVDMLEDGE